MKSNIRILIVDDDDALRGLMRIMLEAKGYDIIEASNGQDAVDIFKKSQIGLVLLDINMPGIDGYDTCYAMREIDIERTTPIVMVTGVDDEAAILAAFQAGADEFILKPINWPLLSNQIDFWICNSQTLNLQRQATRSDRLMLQSVTQSIFRLQLPLTGQIDAMHPGQLGKVLGWPVFAKGRSYLEDYMPKSLILQIMEAVTLAAQQHTVKYVADSVCWDNGSPPLNVEITASIDEDGSAVISIKA